MATPLRITSALVCALTLSVALPAWAVCTVADCPAGYNVIQGTGGDDTIPGTGGNDCILGGDGNDAINGGGGNDYICGGAGNDSIVTGIGTDLIYGEGGDDTIDGGNNDDTIAGGDGNDSLIGGNGNDTIDGGAGDDTINGSNGSDNLNGGPGNDTIAPGTGTDTCSSSDAVAGCENASTAVTLRSFVACSVPGGVELRWETASELTTLGFFAHRAAPDGARVNERLVLGQFTSPLGEHYRVLDVNGTLATPYFLEEVAVAGGQTYGPASPLGSCDPAPAKKSTSLRPMQTAAALENTPARQTPASELYAQVQEGGLYFLDAAQLSAQGFFGSVGQLELFEQGQPWPALLAAEGRLVFYAPSPRALDRRRDAYLVRPAVGAPLMATRAVSPGDALTLKTRLPVTVRVEQHHFLNPAAPPELRFPWGYSYSEAPAAEFRFSLPDYQDAPGHVAVSLIGMSEFGDPTPHRARVVVNGFVLGELTFSGDDAVVLEGDVPAGVLRGTDNLLTLQATADPSVPFDIVGLNFLDVLHTRALVATNDSLSFSLTAGESVRASGFSSQPLLWDITDPANPVSLEGAVAGAGPDGLELTFSDPSALGVRRYLLAVPRAPARLRASLASEVTTTGADYVAIYGEGLGEALAPLLALRQEQGLSVLAVPAMALADRYASGNLGPAAIKSYLAALDPRPRFVVLVGKATVDPRDFLATGTLDLVPTSVAITRDFGVYAAEDLAFVKRPEDGRPFAAIGRLAVSSAEELTSHVTKLLAFEREGAGSGLAVFAADGFDAQTGEPDGFFREQSERVISLLGSKTVERIYLPEQGYADLVSALDQSPELVVFHGHSSGVSWTTRGLLSSDPSNNQLPGLPKHRPFLLVSAGCWDGLFAHPQFSSLTQSLVAMPEGGAIAALASSSLSNKGNHPVLDDAVFSVLANAAPAATVGELWLEAQNRLIDAASASDLLLTYNLLGDPATRLSQPTTEKRRGGCGCGATTSVPVAQPLVLAALFFLRRQSKKRRL